MERKSKSNHVTLLLSLSQNKCNTLFHIKSIYSFVRNIYYLKYLLHNMFYRYHSLFTL